MAGSGFLMLPINGSVPRLVSSSSFSCHASAMSFSPASASVDQENPVADAFLASQERNVIRLGLPSKGRMADETLDLLKKCQLTVRQVNPRQYVADIPQLANLEVWFQRPKDIVRKMVTGDIDLGIVGLDTFSEHGQLIKSTWRIHLFLDFSFRSLSLSLVHPFILNN
ncbi:hypothetical protein ZOSMA_381G00130 [Zostera marina]|uniref:Uncharacterized protein n=1 Tax=Zostera marina TaxID=29655 RepID=A0A0K9P517_ZOSMR|nr:hypothetical protein ZOSMA_381G00130 [Zostera marina]